MNKKVKVFFNGASFLREKEKGHGALRSPYTSMNPKMVLEVNRVSPVFFREKSCT